MNADDIITSDLNVVHLATAGSLAVADGGPATMEPLLSSSEASQSMPATRFSFLPDPSQLQTGFAPGGEPYVLAARFSGILPSAFPNGPVPDSVSSEEGDIVIDDSGHLAESSEPANLIVVADVDLLGDQLWVQVQSFFGQQIANSFASNGAFVVNALENLSGSSDLIGVRSRASFTRPFTRVDALRVDAEARFRATEQRLQSELDETERRLGELQTERDDSGSILLTQEQQDEIDRFIDRRSEIRQELRAVRRGLDADIERLGTILKVINIGPCAAATDGVRAVRRLAEEPEVGRMNNKTLRLLGIVVAFLVVVLFLMERGGETDAPVAGEALLPAFRDAANDVARVQIERADAETVVIQRIDGEWRLPSRNDYPADIGRIRELLLALADAKVVEAKTANPDLHDRLGLDTPFTDTSKGVIVSAVSGDDEFRVVIGNAAQGSYRYARRYEEDQTWLIDQDPDIPQNAGDWLLADIVDIDSSDIQSVSITHPDGETIAISKASADDTNFDVADIPEGRELSYSTVANGIAGALNDLDLDDVRPAADADSAVAAVFTTFDGHEVTVGDDPGGRRQLDFDCHRAGG